MRRAFYTLDVFTNTRFAGNPLAVVTDCEGLSASQMQAIAQEFNLSETVFVLDPLDPVNTARLRIFTPARELPFAGHPTVGAAVLIGELRAPEMLGGQGLGLVLEERIGLISCTVRRPKLQATQASFLLPSLPECLVETLDAGAVAAALGLKAADTGFDAHRPSVWSAGDPFTFVPVASIQAIRRASPNLALFPSTFSGARPAAKSDADKDHLAAANRFPNLIHRFDGGLLAQGGITTSPHPLQQGRAQLNFLTGDRG